MKKLTFDQHQLGSIQIRDYPGAVAVKEIADPEVRELKSITLHEFDLGLARDALLELRSDDKQPLIARSLWTCAITMYFKCFGGNAARGSLDAKSILRGAPGPARQVFDHYLALRNKHVVHDENVYSQGLVAIVINPPGAHCKIADVVSIAAYAVPSKEDIENVLRLVHVALEWTHAKREALHNTLAARYEQRSHAQLLMLPDLGLRAPLAAEVHAKRKR